MQKRDNLTIFRVFVLNKSITDKEEFNKPEFFLILSNKYIAQGIKLC